MVAKGKRVAIAVAKSTMEVKVRRTVISIVKPKMLARIKKAIAVVK